MDLLNKATVVGLVVKEENYKDVEMDIFSREYDEKPITTLIMLWVEDGQTFIYSPQEEHGKWHFITT